MSNHIVDFFRAVLRISPAAAPTVVAARKAVELLHTDNDNIADALAELEALRAKRDRNAAANAQALTEALAAAKSEAERSEVLRKAELDAQNDETNATIRALEESIAAARRCNEEKLGELAVKHSGERAAEQADQKTATDALALVLAAAGEE